MASVTTKQHFFSIIDIFFFFFFFVSFSSSFSFTAAKIIFFFLSFLHSYSSLFKFELRVVTPRSTVCSRQPPLDLYLGISRSHNRFVVGQGQLIACFPHWNFRASYFFIHFLNCMILCLIHLQNSSLFSVHQNNIAHLRWEHSKIGK